MRTQAWLLVWGMALVVGAGQARAGETATAGDGWRPITEVEKIFELVEPEKSSIPIPADPFIGDVLSVSTDKETYAPGEPLRVMLYYQNATETHYFREIELLYGGLWKIGNNQIYTFDVDPAGHWEWFWGPNSTHVIGVRELSPPGLTPGLYRVMVTLRYHREGGGVLQVTPKKLIKVE